MRLANFFYLDLSPKLAVSEPKSQWTKFGQKTGKSSTFYNFVLDFRQIAALRNDGDKYVSGMAKNPVKVVDFWPMQKSRGGIQTPEWFYDLHDEANTIKKSVFLKVLAWPIHISTSVSKRFQTYFAKRRLQTVYNILEHLLDTGLLARQYVVYSWWKQCCASKQTDWQTRCLQQESKSWAILEIKHAVQRPVREWGIGDSISEGGN